MIYRPKRWSLSRGAPSVEPLLVVDMAQHVRVANDEDGYQIEQQIAAARSKLESYLNRALISQTWTFKISEFPSRETDLIELPGGTLQSVTSITYVDADGATQTWDSANYVVDTTRAPGRVGLAYDKDWPDAREWDLPITITYVVGYGAAGADIPPDLRLAMKHMAAFLYDNRGSEDAELPRAVRALASRHRITPAILSA